MSNTLHQFGLRLVEAWNSHDVEDIVQRYAPDFEGVDVSQVAPQLGHEGIRAALTTYLQAFPDLHFALEHVVAQDERLVLVWTAQGTHRDTLLHIPATHKDVSVRGMSLLRVEGDQIKQALNIWDVAGLLRDIGLLPEL